MFITLKLLKFVKLKNVCFVILMPNLCVIFTQQKVVVIDGGHGGKDAGAVGINGIQEKVVVSDIALKILRLNRTILNNEFDIFLTKYIDTLISLSNISRLSKVLNADVFVSLHCNASSTASRGIEVYVHNNDNSNTKPSIALGLSILNESSQKLDFKKLSVKFANFQVFRETITYCPSLLIEIGFVTNADEAVYFLKSKNINATALAILLGITNYLNTGL
jgi:N-acetylmuramoyl-L-alanine amidase